MTVRQAATTDRRMETGLSRRPSASAIAIRVAIHPRF